MSWNEERCQGKSCRYIQYIDKWKQKPHQDNKDVINKPKWWAASKLFTLAAKWIYDIVGETQNTAFATPVDQQVCRRRPEADNIRTKTPAHRPPNNVSAFLSDTLLLLNVKALKICIVYINTNIQKTGEENMCNSWKYRLLSGCVAGPWQRNIKSSEIHKTRC